jgi:hypothetical protein
MAANTNGYVFNFDDAPGEGQSLDDIFGSNSETQAETVVTTTPQVEETQTEPLLKTSTGTVYNTVDDAVKGIEHKDALITQLRQELQQHTHVDPLKKSNTQQEIPVSYSQNPTKYFEDMKAAKDEAALLQVQQRFVNEQLAPYAPLIANMAKSQAIEQVTSEIPKFSEFMRSNDYKETLESFPLLKQSIEISEQYAERSGDLAQLYRMAALASAGRTLPKVVQTAQTVVQTRPTISSTLSTPPTQNATKAVPPSFQTTEGRKALIEQQVNSGVENIRF